MAELKMDTPMKEMAAMTRFTLVGAVAANCNGEGGRGGEAKLISLYLKCLPELKWTKSPYK